MLLALLLAQLVPADPAGPIVTNPATMRQYAFFEAFPASGAGTTTACSTTAPTGAKGEVLTFTRASSATCTKTASGGLATTGIADGDLVSMSSNVARVEYDSAGTLGLLVESSRTNVLLRSQEISNTVWTALGEGGGTAPTKVATDSTIAPDGTVTAETVTFAATSSTQGSFLYQSVGELTGVATHSDFLRAVSGSCTLDICETWNGTANTTCSSCTITDASWTRCGVTGGSGTGTSRFPIIGNVSSRNGGTARAACTAYIWGEQHEVGAYATSYIPTTSAAVTRVVESASFDGLSISSANGLSWAATVWHPSGNGGAVWAAGVNLTQDASNRTQLYRANTNVQQCEVFSTSGNISTGTVISVYTANQAYRQACSYSGAGASSTVSGYRNGTLTGTSAAGLTSAWTATSVLPGALGVAATTGPADGVVSRVCIDPSPTRCR